MSDKPVLDATQVAEQHEEEHEEVEEEEKEVDTSVSCTFKATSAAPNDVVEALEELKQVISAARGQPDSEDHFTGAIRFKDLKAMHAVSNVLKKGDITALKECGLKLMWKGKHVHVPGGGNACPEKPITPPPTAKRGVKVDNLLSFRFSDEAPKQTRRGGGPAGQRGRGNQGGRAQGQGRGHTEGHDTRGRGRGGKESKTHPGYEAAWQSMYGVSPPNQSKGRRGNQDQFAHGGKTRPRLIEAHVLCIQGVPFSTTHDQIVNRLKPDLAAADAVPLLSSSSADGPTVYDIARSDDMALVYMVTSEAVFAAVTTLNGSCFDGRTVMACSGGACKIPAPPGYVAPQKAAEIASVPLQTAEGQ